MVPVLFLMLIFLFTLDLLCPSCLLSLALTFFCISFERDECSRGCLRHGSCITFFCLGRQSVHHWMFSNNPGPHIPGARRNCPADTVKDDSWNFQIFQINISSWCQCLTRKVTWGSYSNRELGISSISEPTITFLHIFFLVRVTVYSKVRLKLS